MPPLIDGVTLKVGAAAVAAAYFRGQNVAGGVTAYSFLSGLPDGFVLTRGGDDRLARNSSGQWSRYAGSAPRVHHTMDGTPLGLVFERSFSDKSKLGFNFVTAPTDTTGGYLTTPAEVSMTPDPSSLTAEGFGAFSSALRHAPAADKNWQIRHTVGNLNKHTVMGVVRENIGTGGAGMSRILMTGASNVSPPVYDEWALISLEDMTPSTTARIGQITALAGHNFDVAGFWLCETKYRPLPYWRTDGQYATVSDEYATAPLAGVSGWSADGCTIYYEWYHDRPFSVDDEPLLALIDADGSDYIRIAGRADGTMRIEVNVGGSSVFSADFAAPSRYENHVAAIRLQPGAFIASVDGVLSAGEAISPSISALDTISINKHGSLLSNQMARSMTISRSLPSDSEFAALSSVSGGII